MQGVIRLVTKTFLVVNCRQLYDVFCLCKNDLRMRINEISVLSHMFRVFGAQSLSGPIFAGVSIVKQVSLANTPSPR